ncbi:MAG: glucose-6-phosphate isomerase [Acidobacteriota bacterium]
MDPSSRWQHFRDTCWCDEDLGLRLDLSRVRDERDAGERLAPALQVALSEMAELEAGSLANGTQQRQVGHYWLRSPERAPDETARREIVESRKAVETFAAAVRGGTIHPAGATRFTRFLLIGIGGSALGPQLVDGVLRSESDGMRASFLDNTDPDGFAEVLDGPGCDLSATLIITASKSGTTPETRNGMLAVRAACARSGVDFSSRAVAVTSPGSCLDDLARTEGWLARFSIPEWVGGRTSVMSAIGLLPAALSGFDHAALLDGAAAMDARTREATIARNPAARLARAWYLETGGRGDRDLVVLPYRDRLALLPRYLQQLIMESIGKRCDRDGKVVHQGLTVYGGKGSTDQHAYVQQLRDGLPRACTLFVNVLEDVGDDPIDVGEGLSSSDHLFGFLLGTRAALDEGRRDSITLTVNRLDARALGAVIALCERTVGLYASLINVNAYDQPGVEAGKAAAVSVLGLQRQIVAVLKNAGGTAMTVAAVAEAVDARDEMVTVFEILERLAYDRWRAVRRIPGSTVLEATYAWAAAG